MNQQVTAYDANKIDAYYRKLERGYAPSTFKFARIGNIMDGIMEFLRFPSGEDEYREYKKDPIVIDDKEIENDFAVVAKDMMLSMKIHGKSTQSKRRKK